MKIDFCFSGWVRGANIRWATPASGYENNVPIWVADMPPQELASKLQSGELHIALGDFLYEAHDDVEIELFDFKEKGLFVNEDDEPVVPDNLTVIIPNDLMGIDEWVQKAWPTLPKACYISIQLIDDHYDLEVEAATNSFRGRRFRFFPASQVYGTESDELITANLKALELDIAFQKRGVRVFKLRNEWEKYLEDNWDG